MATPPPSRRQLKLPVPVHVLTGSLSSGKTSLILHLMASKPADEVWAVLVNEAGAVGIDQALLSAAASKTGGTVVRELAGGCLCCALSTVTSAALVQLVRSAKPDRLIIEPSGLAHPAALLAMLRSQHLRGALDIRPIVCLVDLSRFSPIGASPYNDYVDASPAVAEPSASSDELPDRYAPHVKLADILVGTKADLPAAKDRISQFHVWARTLEPPKAKVLTCGTSSRPSPAELGMEKPRMERPSDGNGEEAKKSKGDKIGENAAAPPDAAPPRRVRRLKQTSPFKAVAAAQPGRPERRLGEGQTPTGGSISSCGWIFCPSDVFDESKVWEFANAARPHVMRLKGIFRVAGARWIVASLSWDDDEHFELMEVADQKDSRVEVIVGGGSIGTEAAEGGGEVESVLRSRDWDQLENILDELRIK